MKIAIWGPWPSASSGAADQTAALLPALARHHDVVAVADDPAAADRASGVGVPVVAARPAPPADLDVYSIGNTPACVLAYRAALARPGVVVLDDWGLHDLVWADARDRGDLPHYLREMRSSGGEAGSFVGRQVVRGLGGTALPALFAANDRLLERSLGVATLTREVGERARRRFPWLPNLYLPSPLADHGLESTAARLGGFLEEVRGDRERLLGPIEADRATDGTLTGYCLDEVRRAAKDLGISIRDLDLGPVHSALATRR